MVAYKVTIGQKNALLKPKKYKGMCFNVRQDINGDWFVSEVEKQFCEDNFGWTLTPSEFVPPVTPSIYENEEQP